MTTIFKSNSPFPGLPLSIRFMRYGSVSSSDSPKLYKSFVFIGIVFSKPAMNRKVFITSVRFFCGSCCKLEWFEVSEVQFFLKLAAVVVVGFYWLYNQFVWKQSFRIFYAMGCVLTSFSTLILYPLSTLSTSKCSIFTTLKQTLQSSARIFQRHISNSCEWCNNDTNDF